MGRSLCRSFVLLTLFTTAAWLPVILAQSSDSTEVSISATVEDSVTSISAIGTNPSSTPTVNATGIIFPSDDCCRFTFTETELATITTIVSLYFPANSTDIASASVGFPSVNVTISGGPLRTSTFSLNTTASPTNGLPLNSTVTPTNGIPVNSTIAPTNGIPLNTTITPTNGISFNATIAPTNGIPINSTATPTNIIPFNSTVSPTNGVTLNSTATPTNIIVPFNTTTAFGTGTGTGTETSAPTASPSSVELVLVLCTADGEIICQPDGTYDFCGSITGSDGPLVYTNYPVDPGYVCQDGEVFRQTRMRNFAGGRISSGGGAGSSGLGTRRPAGNAVRAVGAGVAAGVS